MGTKITRTDKIGWIKFNIERVFNENSDCTINEKKFLAMFALEHHSSIRVGKEILDLFVKTDMIKIVGGEIYDVREK
ncbi:MAG: hypothetical protein ABFQ65_00065 [Nanoarchaeota archaeon]